MTLTFGKHDSQSSIDKYYVILRKIIDNFLRKLRGHCDDFICKYNGFRDSKVINFQSVFKIDSFDI